MSDDRQDDFKVVSPSNMGLLIEKINELEKYSEKINWKELGTRSGTDSRDSSLLKAALTLTITQSSPALYRKSDSANELMCSLWMAEVMAQAQLIALKNGDTKFTELSLDDLRSIAKLSTDIKDFPSLAETLLRAYGIIVVCHRSYAGMKMDGLVTRLPNGLPVIGLSVRYPRYDNFWFTLMHELAHIALHYEMLDEAIYDDLDNSPASEIEREANTLATDSFIPRRLFSKAAVLRSRREDDLHQLATEAGIHPIVVAGQMHFYFGNYKLFGKLVSSLDLNVWLKETP